MEAPDGYRNGTQGELLMSAQLRKARRRMGLTQDDVAREVGIARATYASYETGRRMPDVRTALRIARLLGQPVEQLFSLTRRSRRVS